MNDECMYNTFIISKLLSHVFNGLYFSTNIQLNKFDQGIKKPAKNDRFFIFLRK